MSSQAITPITRTVTLVDQLGNILGECPIQEAHALPGKLHLAFSAYLFSEDKTELLIQKRHEGKLFGGMWANSCCSHPFSGEPAIDAGQRRVREELGVDVNLEEAGCFIYRAEDPRRLGVEHELDVLLAGAIRRDALNRVDPNEIADWRWAKVDDLWNDMKAHQESYAPWFHMGLSKVITQYISANGQLH
jgi:isopentenyl-diphosphate delta-isomerase